MPDGSVPQEVIEPLTTVGNWLSENGKAVYGRKDKSKYGSSSGVCGASCSGNRIYLWNWIWPSGGEMTIGGFMSPVKAVRLVKDGSEIDFEQKGHRIMFKNLPCTTPDSTAGIAVLELEFEGTPEFNRCSYYPQLHGGRDFAGDNKI